MARRGGKVTSYTGGQVFYDFRLAANDGTWKLASIIEGSK